MLGCICGGCLEVAALALVGGASVVVPYVRDTMILKRRRREAGELNRALRGYPVEHGESGIIGRKEFAARVAEQMAS